MKKTRYLSFAFLAILLLVFVAGCSSNNGSQPTPSPSAEQSGNANQATAGEALVDTDAATIDALVKGDSNNPLIGIWKEKDDDNDESKYRLFKADGAYTILDVDKEGGSDDHIEQMVGSYETAGDKLTLKISQKKGYDLKSKQIWEADFNNTAEVFTYQVQGDTLKLTETDDDDDPDTDTFDRVMDANSIVQIYQQIAAF